MTGPLSGLVIERRCHDIAYPGEAQWRLSLAAAGVVACIAVDWFILPEVTPVEVDREIRTALHVAGGVDMDGSDARPARLGRFPADIAGDLLQVIIRIGDDAAALALEREELGYDLFEMPDFGFRNQPLGVAVLAVGVAAEVDSNAEFGGAVHDRNELTDVGPLDDGVEADRVDATLAHRGNVAHDPVDEPRNAAGIVVPLIQEIERDVELVYSCIPEGLRALGREHPAMSDERHVLHANRTVHRRYEIFEVASQRRLASRPRDHHGV